MIQGFNDNGDWEGTYEYVRDAAKKKFLKIAEGGKETTGVEGEGENDGNLRKLKRKKCKIILWGRK